MSYRAIRNTGLFILLAIIFLESVFAFDIMSRSSRQLSSIITSDQVKLRKWYDIAEIVSDAKDSLYDYRLGRSEVVAPVDLLINRLIREIDSIKKITNDEEELATIAEISDTAKKLRHAIYAFESEVREGYRGGASAKEMEEIVIQTVEDIAEMGRGAASYISNRIAEKNHGILKISYLSQKLLAAVLLLAVIATVVVAVFMARALEKPIKHLVEGTKRVAEGDLAVRVKVESDDEIGQLANAFNTMAERVKKSQNEILAAKTYADNIIRSMTNSLVVVGPDSKIKTVNRATCDLLGYREEDLIGNPVSTLFAAGFFTEIGLDKLIRSGFTSNLKTTFLASDGREIRVLFSSSVMHNDTGEIEGIVCVAQDITLQEEAVRAGHLASLGELAAGVAHEINNPINGIINFSQLLIDEIESGGTITDEIPQRIIKEGDRVSTIVSSLLSFARESDTDKDLVTVKDILVDTLALAETQIKKEGIDLRLDIPAELPPILAQSQQIQQVFLNILNNARYALNKKFDGVSPDKILMVTARQESIDGRPFITFDFHDQGTGIPASIIDKIMNPFFSTKPAGTGTGLGLAISHGIIADHDGKLLLESKEGEYTKVTVLLPVGDVENESV